MWKTSIVAAILSCFAQSAFGEHLRIDGQTWLTISESTCSITLDIKNSGPPDVLLSGWQMVFQIDPVDDSSENVFFSSLSNYTPTGYVFGNQSFGISRSDLSSTAALFMDFSTALEGGVYVQSPNNNLLQFSLSCPDKKGTYDIILTSFAQSDTGSYWLDGFWGSHAIDVASPPRKAKKNVVATVVFSSVPEPPSTLLLVSGVVTIMFIGIFCRKHHPA